MKNKLDLKLKINKEDFKKKLGIVDGKTPTKEELLAIIEPLIPEPIPGKKGEDYILTDQDKVEIASSIDVPIVEKIIEKTQIVKEVEKKETKKELKDKIEDLGIDYDKLSNTPDIDKIISIAKQSSKTVSLSELDDVNLTGVTITNGKYDLGSGSGGDYTPQGTTTVTVGGIASGTNLGTTAVPVQDILDDMLYPYTAPTTTLTTTPTHGLREIGNATASVILASTTTKNTNNITSFIYEKNGSTIYTAGAPIAAGGSEGYTDATGFDGLTDITYEAIVGDGTSTGSASRTFTMIATYYYGVGAVGLDISADGGGLTKYLINDTASVTRTFSPTSQVYYFAYPASYAALTSILDTNGFETISDWTVTTGNVTNSYGVVTSYRKYEFANLTTQTNFNITFVQ